MPFGIFSGARKAAGCGGRRKPPSSAGKLELVAASRLLWIADGDYVSSHG
jgi:hypothetical protein